jgi:hypothetical protein
MCGLVEAASCYGIKVFTIVRFTVLFPYVMYYTELNRKNLIFSLGKSHLLVVCSRILAYNKASVSSDCGFKHLKNVYFLFAEFTVVFHL